MNIELVRSRRRSISIEITPELRVIVRAPLRMSEKEINRFIGEKSDWITTHYKKMQEKHQNAQEAVPLSEQDIKLLVTKAKRVIPPKVRRYADVIGVDYGRITIRMQKSRWGSCSGKGNLNFNCLLMNAPEGIVDYVVVHELCHRKEMNHSPRFWNEVGKVLPDYKDRRKWLKEHGSELLCK